MELLMAMNLMRDPDRRVAAAAEIRHYLERAAASTGAGHRSAAGALLGHDGHRRMGRRRCRWGQRDSRPRPKLEVQP
jgi:hypothetical protein